MRHLATPAAITLLALTGCSAAEAGQDSQGAKPTTLTATTATIESKGTLEHEEVKPIRVPIAAPGTVPKINVKVSCITSFPGIITVVNRAADQTASYVLPSPRSEDIYPREVVEQLVSDDDTAQVVDHFDMQLSNTFPEENYFVVGIRTGEVTKPDDYCSITASAASSNIAFLRETVPIAPDGGGKLFTFQFPPSIGTAAPEPLTAAQVPETTFSDGTHLVGTDIVPGTYRAPGSARCYYARQSDLSGEFNAIISNGSGVGPIITIAESDAAFTSRNCGQWQQAE